MIEDTLMALPLIQKNLKCTIDCYDSFLDNDPTEKIVISGYYSAFELVYLEIMEVNASYSLACESWR